jgi:hypothetical protein
MSPRSKTDPIFSLIETHRQREAALVAIISELGPIEKRLRLQGLRASDEPDDPELSAYNRRYEAAENGSSRAMRKMCSQKPGTIAGLLALLEYLQPLLREAFVNEYSDGRTDNLPGTLIKAVRCLACPTGPKHSAQPDHYAMAAE